MGQQEKEELSFDDESISCDSTDDSDIIDATEDFQLGVR